MYLLLGDLQATGGRPFPGPFHQPDLMRGKCVECKGTVAAGPNGERIMDAAYLKATGVFLCDKCREFVGYADRTCECGFTECETHRPFSPQYMSSAGDTGAIGVGVVNFSEVASPEQREKYLDHGVPVEFFADDLESKEPDQAQLLTRLRKARKARKARSPWLINGERVVRGQTATEVQMMQDELDLKIRADLIRYGLPQSPI